jgi:hypothetical protein
MGRQVSGRYIRELRLRNVIGSGGKGGRGKMTEYPSGTAELVCAIVDAATESPGVFRRTVLTAWWNGAPVGDLALRRAFAQQFAETLRKTGDGAAGERSRGSDRSSPSEWCTRLRSSHQPE